MIGIIGAMASEVDGLKAIMSQLDVNTISTVDFYKGKINDTDVVVAQAGVGKVNAALTAQTMILEFKVDVVINIGVAGGIADELRIGDIVVADRVCEHDMDTTPLGDPAGFITGIDCIYMECDKSVSNLIMECTKELGYNSIYGTIASGDVFVSTDEQRNKIRDVFNGAAAEMEGGAIGHVCTMNNVPFAVLRAMSDCANDDSKVDFPTFAAKAAENSIEIIKLFLKKVGK